MNMFTCQIKTNMKATIAIANVCNFIAILLLFND